MTSISVLDLAVNLSLFDPFQKRAHVPLADVGRKIVLHDMERRLRVMKREMHAAASVGLMLAKWSR